MFGWFKKKKEIPGFNFVAIDFETANPNKASICQYGITFVKDGRITSTITKYIKPVPYEFFWANVKVHGIKESDIQNAPTFLEHWNEFKGLISNNILIAHNIKFDIGCINAFTKTNNLEPVNNNYACSLELSKVLLSMLPNHKLNTVCNHLGIDLNHHDASSDSKACASIVLKIAYTHKFNSIEEIISLSKTRRRKPTKINNIKPIVKATSGPFFGKVVVITGTLVDYDRDMAKNIIIENGGIVRSGVSSKTDILIVGIGGVGTRKYNDACEYQDEGLDIKIIEEDTFYKLIK